MRVLLSLKVDDLKEMLVGGSSLMRRLGPRRGIDAITSASLKHLRAIINGEGAYPEPGKRRIWFKLHFLRGVYEYLAEDDEEEALSVVENAVLDPAVKFIGQFVPPAPSLTKEIVLHRVWHRFVENDYNVEATVDPVDGSSVSLCVTRCFFNEVVRDLGMLPLADIICGTDFRFWEGYHENVRFSRTKTLLAGDSICNHTLTWVD